jgi:hypothetical protein
VSSAEAAPKTLELDSGAKVDARLLAGARSETNSIRSVAAPGSMAASVFSEIPPCTTSSSYINSSTCTLPFSATGSASLAL